MILAGLTGNIGSGKSEVARILGELGATVIDADVLARDAVRPGSPALAKIVSRWGADVLGQDGSLDRAELRRIVFQDRSELEALNAIVHPEVRRLRDALVADARARGDRVVVAEIPLLFESGLEGDFDRVILVDAPEEVRLRRIVASRGITEQEARRMLAAQDPSDEKRRKAGHVIDNAGTRAELRRKTLELWESLTSTP